MKAEHPAVARGVDALIGLIDGYRSTALIYTAVRLGLPELMGSDPWDPAALATRLDCLPDQLRRIVRGLAAIGLCEEDANGRFTLSPGGLELRAVSASGLRERVLLAAEHYWPAWAGLAGCAEHEGTAFEQINGITAWEFRRSHAALDRTFNTWLAKETSASAAGLADAIAIGDARRVADIGGGDGGLLLSLLSAHPDLTGILFDQPHVVEARRADGHCTALEYVGGDFFSPFTVDADLYLIKSVIHDWNDEQARTILSNCRAAMSPDSRLLLIERVLPAKASDNPAAVLLDLHMLAVTGGRERTVPELQSLLRDAGFTVTDVAMSGSGHAVIEGRVR